MSSTKMYYLVFRFIELQCRLTRAFADLYPDAKDLRWLLDFPKSGEVLVDCEQWRFVKHGAGLRFERMIFEPHWVIDIHKCFDKPKLIDSWRLLQFYESCGEVMDEAQVLSLLNAMCSKGHLFPKGAGQYLFVDY